MVLPIRQNEQYMGLAELSGLLRAESDTIVLEYSLKDEMLGMFNSDLKVLKIPFHTVEEIQVKKKWFSARFEIHLNRLPKTDKSLSMNGNVISFIIKKKELQKAKSIRSTLMLRISERRLQQFEDDEFAEKEKVSDFEFTSKPIDQEQHKSGSTNSDGLKNMLRDSDS